MKIGFTGTKVGMSLLQVTEFKRFLSRMTEMHNGDCIGADEEAAKLALEEGIRVVLHPPIEHNRRAFVEGCYWTHTPKPYLERNKDIVDSSDLLIACPKESHEVLRSGTWATIRYARRKDKPIIMIFPTGDVVTENLPCTLPVK